jgi:hypothetical protein
VASFTDPGNKGTIITPYYFVSTVYGCCALPSRNRVRTLETGRELFTSTGSGQAGAAIWMSVPNARPTIERWAAFEGEMGRGTYSTSRRLGVFSYGGPDGPLSTVALVSKAWSPILESPETRAHLELMDTLSSCGTLGWIERGKRVRPLEGGCLPHNAYPGPSLFSLERKTAPEGIGGIAVELSALGTVYATIPVENDRLGLAHATVKEGIILTEQTKP